VRCGSSPEQTVPCLLDEEERMEGTRLSGDAAYSVARHIDLLIALMAEAQLLRRAAVV
jgi:hypothetical protein